MITYPTLIKSLSRATNAEDCLELLAESRRTMGFDAVAFRNFSGEPVYRHLSDWRHWGSEFGWPTKFLDRFQGIRDFAFIKPDGEGSMSTIVPWTLREASKFPATVSTQPTRDSLLAALLRQNVDSGVTTLVSRPFGQVGSVNWIRCSPDRYQQPKTREMDELQRFGELFFQVMDDISAWRQFSTLTSKELKCLELAARGYSDKCIAQAIQRSVDTVRFHMKRANKKLGAANRTQAVATAITNNLIEIYN
jgi:DNA-binding CsgD family transcriptional regulator